MAGLWSLRLGAAGLYRVHVPGPLPRAATDGYVYSRRPHEDKASPYEDKATAQLVRHREEAFLGAARMYFEIRPDNSLLIRTTQSNAPTKVSAGMSDRLHEIK